MVDWKALKVGDIVRRNDVCQSVKFTVTSHERDFVVVESNFTIDVIDNINAKQFELVR